MRRTTLVFATLIALMLLSMILVNGCSRQGVDDLPMDAAWAKIKNYFDRGRYLDASEHLEIFLINYAGSTLADSAQWLLAESHFEMKEYIISASEYEKLITQYPRSRLVEQGEYKLALSYSELSPKFHKEQIYTEKAVEMFQLFIEDFPSSMLVSDAETRMMELRSKLAKKEFRAGRLYHRMGQYQAARIYYQSVLDDYYDSEFAEDAQLYKAESWADQKQWDEALAALQGYLNRYPESEHRDDVLKQIEDVRESKRRQLEEEQKEGKSIFDIFGSDD